MKAASSWVLGCEDRLLFRPLSTVPVLACLLYPTFPVSHPLIYLFPKPLLKLCDKVCWSPARNAAKLLSSVIAQLFFVWDLAVCRWDLAECGWDLAECGWDLAENGWDLAECGWDLTEWAWYLAEPWMRSSRVWMRSSRVWMRSSQVWIRSI